MGTWGDNNEAARTRIPDKIGTMENGVYTTPDGQRLTGADAENAFKYDQLRTSNDPAERAKAEEFGKTVHDEKWRETLDKNNEDAKNRPHNNHATDNKDNGNNGNPNEQNNGNHNNQQNGPNNNQNSGNGNPASTTPSGSYVGGCCNDECRRCQTVHDGGKACIAKYGCSGKSDSDASGPASSTTPSGSYVGGCCNDECRRCQTVHDGGKAC